MTEFNRAKFESKAKKLVAEYLNYEINEKDVFIVWFCKVGANAKAMLSSDLDYHYFEITYFGEEGKYVVDAYDFDPILDVASGAALGEKSNGSSTSHVQADVDKVKFKFIEAYSKPELEKEVDKFLAGDIKLVDWKFNSYDGYYMFTCTYRELSILD